MKTRATLTAISLGAALALGGCSLAASITTSNEYDPSDGIGTTVGSVSTENFLLVTSGEGEPAVLVGALYNSSTSPVTVSICIGADTASIKVPAQGVVKLGLGEDDEQIIIDAPAAPGGIADVSIAPSDAPATVKPIPVVDGTQPEYQAVLDELAKVEG